MSDIVDLAVVGAGFLGLSGAASFADTFPEPSIVVLSQEEHPGFGSASASTGGHILPGFELSNAELIDRYGLPDAKRLFDFTCAGARHLLETSTDAAPMPTAIGITDGSDRAWMQREIEVLARLGHDSRALEPSQLSAPGLGGCLDGYLDSTTGILRGESRVAALHDMVEAAGARFVQAEAVSIARAKSHVEIRTRSERITARKAIIAAGENSPALLELSDDVRTQITTSFRFDAPEGAPDMAACQSATEPEYYWVRDGELRFGIRATPVPSVETAIERVTHRFGLAPGRLRAVASGNIVHRDGLMPNIVVGERYFSAYGFGGHGVVLSNWLGHLAGLALAGDAAKHQELREISAILGSEDLLD